MANTDIGWMHADALKVLLDGGTTYPVYVGEVTASDDELEWPYLVLWPPPANRPVSTMAGYVGDATTVIQVTAAGRTIREVLAALDRASAALHRRRPTIPGRRCELISQVPGVPPAPQPDKEEAARINDGLPIYFSFVQFSLYSTAATAAVFLP